jgi:hypothetical protein
MPDAEGLGDYLRLPANGTPQPQAPAQHLLDLFNICFQAFFILTAG